MEAFFFFAMLWLLAWAIFLISVLVDDNGHRVRTRTLLDDIEVEL